jgi:hypothetical protein
LNLDHDEPLSKFAFKFTLRRYTTELGLDNPGRVRPNMLFILPSFPMLNSSNTAWYARIMPKYAQLCRPLSQRRDRRIPKNAKKFPHVPKSHAGIFGLTLNPGAGLITSAAAGSRSSTADASAGATDVAGAGEVGGDAEGEEARGAVAGIAAVGSGKYFSPRQRMPFNSRNECFKCVLMTWRALDFTHIACQVEGCLFISICEGSQCASMMWRAMYARALSRGAV